MIPLKVFKEIGTSIHLQSVIAFSAVTILSCKNPESANIQLPPPPPPPYSWPTSTLQAQGIDPDSIASALQEFQAKPYVESFVLVRNAFLVTESYSTLADKYTNAELASVTKSVGSALVGIALREGYLDSLGQKMLDFFPEYVTPILDPRKHDITIEHLLTMRSGFEYTEGDDHSVIFNQGTDWMREAINLPLRNNPGETFNYASVNVHLVSGILTKASHLSTMSFAQQFLFQPLNITALSWPKDPQNYYFLGSGMVLYPRDMARFGYLYVNGGSVDGHSIIPADWAKASVQPHDDQSRTWGAFTNVKYGYFWWTAEWNTDSVFLAVGFGGQFIIGVPRYNLVIVVTSNLNCTQTEADERHFAILDILARHVLSAVRS
jgi:CubicO group peptidase (beta-lactamase class C family)